MNRIFLSKLKREDQQQTFELVQDQDVMHFLGPRRPLDDNEANDWFEKELNAKHRFAFRLESNNELIGFCGITQQDGQWDFGYFLRKKYWHQGYAKEMCELAITQLKKHFNFEDVRIFIAEKNIASQKLAQKLNWLKIKKEQNEYENGWLFQIPAV